MSQKQKDNPERYDTKGFEAGDVVRLKSGGPNMVIDSMDPNNIRMRAICWWFHDGHVLDFGFPPHMIEKVSQSE